MCLLFYTAIKTQRIGNPNFNKSTEEMKKQLVLEGLGRITGKDHPGKNHFSSHYPISHIPILIKNTAFL